MNCRRCMEKRNFQKVCCPTKLSAQMFRLRYVSVMLSMPEIIRWLNISVLEIWQQCIGIFLATVLLTLKLEFYPSISYWHVFVPLFGATVLNAYFLFIVLVRTIVEEDDYKEAVARYWLSYVRIFSIACFEVSLAYKITSELEHADTAVRSSYGVVFLPIWVLMGALCFQACKML
uniref:Transmembrane protein n=1 Tax=Syphacia muris TaxID=451379 RepID=A0A0N5AUX5_9BILA